MVECTNCGIDFDNVEFKGKCPDCQHQHSFNPQTGELDFAEISRLMSEQPIIWVDTPPPTTQTYVVGIDPAHPGVENTSFTIRLNSDWQNQVVYTPTNL